MINVMTHKAFDDSFVDRDHYRIVHVGSNSNCKSDYARDDTEDNISDKNPYYCELTGQYWVWKNVQEAPDDVSGLVHYRRFFTTLAGDLSYTYFNKTPKILPYTTICKTLRTNDIILPARVKIVRTVGQFYADLHNVEDLKITRSCIQEVCPDYLGSYDAVMNEHSFIYGNMFIAKREVFDRYCEWLFPLMNDIESKIDVNKYDSPYQARVLGFLSERLLQVWVEHNHLKVKEYPVFNTENRRITVFEKNVNRVKKLFK